MCNNKYKIDRQNLNRRICYMFDYKLMDDRIPLDVQGTIPNFPLFRKEYNKDREQFEYILIGYYTITILPNKEPIITKRNGYSWQGKKYKARKHSAKHRIYIHCNCGRQISSGRFHQHACKERV